MQAVSHEAACFLSHPLPKHSQKDRYGRKIIQTPRVAMLAANGVMFEYAPVTGCPASTPPLPQARLRENRPQKNLGKTARKNTLHTHNAPREVSKPPPPG